MLQSHDISGPDRGNAGRPLASCPSVAGELPEPRSTKKLAEGAEKLVEGKLEAVNQKGFEILHAPA